MDRDATGHGDDSPALRLVRVPDPVATATEGNEASAPGLPDPLAAGFAAPAPGISEEAFAAHERAAGWSANTCRAYWRAWSTWQAWAAAHGVGALPARWQDVRAYLLERAAAGRTLATLRADADGIAAVHTTTRQPNPCAKGGAVRMALTRLAKGRGRAPRQVAALDAAALAAIRATAAQPRRGTRRRESPAAARRRALLDCALVGLLSDGGLRRSEAAALLWGDVACADDGSGRVTVRRSKTDPTGEGAVVAVTRTTMEALAALRDEAPDDAPVIGLSTRQIARRIKAAALAAGLGDGFSGHSGRVGMARRMVRAGAPTATVQRQGRWKSPAMVAAYTRAESAAEALRFLE